MVRLRAVLAALTSLLLALSLGPGQGAQDLREAAAQIAVPASGDATAAAPDRISAGHAHLSPLDGDPAAPPSATMAAVPGGASKIASTLAVAATRGLDGTHLPPARGPPAPVA
jgi:hypothetical protein